MPSGTSGARSSTAARRSNAVSAAKDGAACHAIRYFRTQQVSGAGDRPVVR
jgi:hypothetical protein